MFAIQNGVFQTMFFMHFNAVAIFNSIIFIFFKCKQPKETGKQRYNKLKNKAFYVREHISRECFLFLGWPRPQFSVILPRIPHIPHILHFFLFAGDQIIFSKIASFKIKFPYSLLRNVSFIV